MAQNSGFTTAYLSGASISYTRFGRPDIGLVGMDEVAQTLSQITERTDLPLIVDADTGFGNALNVRRTVALLERHGAAAIQLEDQQTPKRCGHLDGKTLVGVNEMTGKIRAAIDSRKNDTTLIIARTDAIAVEGINAAIERANHYIEAGAEVIFVEAPRNIEEMLKVAESLRDKTYLLANMVEGGETPDFTINELEQMGYKIVIFPGSLARAVAHLMLEYFSSLKTNGSTKSFKTRMLDFQGINDVIGTTELMKLGELYGEMGLKKKND